MIYIFKCCLSNIEENYYYIHIYSLRNYWNILNYLIYIYINNKLMDNYIYIFFILN
jgi:hypothetical protein